MKRLKKFYFDIYRAFKNEFKFVIKDKGLLIFLFLVPLLYPIVYALIYNPELTRDVPVAIVDDSRSVKSRELARKIDASESAMVAGYATDMEEAKRWIAEKRCYGIVHIDRDFDRNIVRGEQGTVSLYCEMSLLIRYKSLLVALTESTMDLGSDIRIEKMYSLGADAPKVPPTVSSTYFALGNPEQGFATFLLPAILILIVQQTIILSVCMMGGAIYERRRRYGDIDPFDTRNSGAVSRMLGKAMAFIILYLGQLIYLLYFVPKFFSYPQYADLFEVILLCVPYLFAAVFFGMTLQVIVRERETSFVLIVVTSVIFLFLSGIPWPLYDMSPAYRFASACCPSTWAMQAFVRMNANGASLGDVSHEYMMLWLNAIGYFFIALFINKASVRHHIRQYSPEKAQ